MANKLQLGAVGIAAQARSRVSGAEIVLQSVGFDMQAAVADREVELAVGSETQAVHVVADEGDVNAIAGMERLFHVGPARPLGVLQQPQIGDAGVPDFAVARENAGAEPVRGGFETVGEHSRFVGPARALGVLQQANAIVVYLIGGEFPLPDVSCTWRRDRRRYGKQGRHRASTYGCDCR